MSGTAPQSPSKQSSADDFERWFADTVRASGVDVAVSDQATVAKLASVMRQPASACEVTADLESA